MEFGGSSPHSLFRPHIPNCCKMWFPMVETGGSRITDIAGGVVLTPASMSRVIENAVRVEAGNAIGIGASGIAPTMGSIPAIGSNDFILFAVQQNNEFTSRANTYIALSDASGNWAGVFDGDGAGVNSSVYVPPNWESSAESIDGAIYYDNPLNSSGNALVRNGGCIGDWVHPTIVDVGQQGNMCANGDIFGRVLRNANYDPNNSATYGAYGRNDYGLPAAVIADWQNPNGPAPTILSYNGMTFGSGSAGLPGVWPYISPSYAIPAMTRIQIGQGLGSNGGNDYFGIALFVFQSGLPSDFKNALRWMKAQWMAGNKVIWPGWANL